MKKLMTTMLCCMFFLGGVAGAAELSDSHTRLLKESGIPLYKDTQFIDGGLGDAVVGARFATSAAVDDVRTFYRKAFPGWALQSEYGWTLYDGKPSKSPAAFMGKKSVTVLENKNLPEWFGLPQNMTTEVMIVVP
ncbi:MAG: hypothetical protein C0614_13190 [Desulfuromonas sp.]|nr:MAG: hypothetical protein C0614_13190 [Desulfuromonas sp.]